MEQEGVFASHDHISLQNISMTGSMVIVDESGHSGKITSSRKVVITKSVDLFTSGRSGSPSFDSQDNLKDSAKENTNLHKTVSPTAKN